MRDILRDFNRHPENYGCDPYKYLDYAGNIGSYATLVGGMKEGYVADGMGHRFNSVEEMCTYYGTTVKVYMSKRKYGVIVSDALKTDRKRGLSCADGYGRVFNSLTAMCKYYNINPQTFKQRIDCGWELQEALETPAINKYGNKKNDIQ